MQQSRQVWLAADHSKFDRPALVELGHLAQVDALFTDQPVSAEMAEVLAAGDTRLVVAA
ncbi:Glycerol-3-phosphate regulon repressor [compost metagenome]